MIEISFIIFVFFGLNGLYCNGVFLVLKVLYGLFLHLNSLLGYLN